MGNARRFRTLSIVIAGAGLAASSVAFWRVYGAEPDVGAALSRSAFLARIRGTAISHEIACERGSAIDCGIAAAMLREGDPDDLARAARLGARACTWFGSPHGPEGPTDTDDARSEIACQVGDPESCTIAARTATGRGHTWRAAALHQLACDAGDPLACETALRARRIAKR